MAHSGSNSNFFDRVQYITEKILTYRKRKRRIKKEKRAGKNQALDWIEAFLWAAGMVLLINQYLMQAYSIPSGSMINTLNIGDHVFVNKIIYGPEILPGLFKLPSPFNPKRNDIIIFENPTYISRGPAFDITQRIIYMLTLSLVDIDRDEKGDPRVHFLIKRAAGWAGDHFFADNGEMMIRFAGEDRIISEREYNALQGWDHNLSRLIKQEQYAAINAWGKAEAWVSRGLMITEALTEKASSLQNSYLDSIVKERAYYETLRKINPNDRRYTEQLTRNKMGWYIPEGRIFPLGDNRDNSKDGRFFGPVKISKVLGKGMIVYWPLRRMKVIR